MAIEERDPVTGEKTTGHEWNGITELNTPVPKVVLFFLILTTLIAVLYWIFLPAFPWGSSYTKGILGKDQRTTVQQSLETASLARSSWVGKMEESDFDAILEDPELMKIVREAGGTLFGDNCAVCHGTSGAGSTGFPSLSDSAWLWGGDADVIAETLRVGINAEHDDTRSSEMLAFGRDELLEHKEIRDLVSYIQSLGTGRQERKASAEEIVRGEELFADNCSSCHGDEAEGIPELGAPNLTDTAWIYGGDRRSLYATIFSGRQGHMPSWDARLSDADRKILSLYVLSLQEQEP